MKSELAVSRWAGISSSLGNLIVLLGRLGVLGVGVWMLTYCRECQGARNDFGVIGTVVLPLLGLSYGIFITVIGYLKDRPRQEDKLILTDLYYGAIALTTLGGGVIFSARFYIGSEMCVQCLTFWIFHAILFCELVMRSNRMGVEVEVALVAIGAIQIFGIVPDTDAKAFVIRNLSSIGIVKQAPGSGLPVGSKAPALPELATRSYQLITWTECPVCLRGNLPGIVKDLANNREVYVVTVSPKNLGLIEEQIPNARPIVVDQLLFEQWRVGLTGSPRGFVVIDGTVTANLGGEKQ